MKIAIFSDMHLRYDEKDSIALFEDLLKKLAEENPESGNELWLLGDVFEVLVGPFREWKNRCPGIYAALEKLIGKGWKVLWIQGNHDFFIEDFVRALGIEVTDTEVVRTIAGKKIYLAHGDRVNQDDVKYLRWRAWTRSRSFQKAVLWLQKTGGIRAIETVALKIGHRSRKQGPGPDELNKIRSLYREFARWKWAEGYDLVLLGHSHIEENLQDGKKAYQNLGSWVNYSPRYALWDPEKESFPKIVFS
jgi:UDP-2,3-diacylglucosamine hydrolase